MIEYLSDEWFHTAAARVASATIATSGSDPISFGYEINEIPGTHAKAGSVVKYRIDLDPATGTAALSLSDEPGDVRFSMSYEIAVGVAQGSTSGSRAFLDGSIRLGGDVSALIERAEDLRMLNDLTGVDRA